MTDYELLTAVLPEAGPYLLAVPKQFTNDDGEVVHYFKHIVCHSVSEMVERAGRIATKNDVYFALGSIRNAKDKKLRKATNIKRLRAFWLDIDVREDGGQHYATHKEAAQNLKSFVQATSLPRPCIVDSGGGLHVYWPLTEGVDPEQWEHYAQILKAACKQHGLKADPARTADVASVLRVPGTTNMKYDPPKPVTVAVGGAPMPPKQVMTALAAIPLPPAGKVRASLDTSALGALPEFLRDAEDVNKEAAGGLEVVYTEANPKQVVMKCRQLKWQALNPRLVEEPQWYDMVGCLRHAADGAKAIHLLSKGYPKYSQVETDRKIKQHEEGGAGPTLCATFEDHNPGRCEGCPYAGKISTPLMLGREMQRAEAPVAVRPALEMEAPEPPTPLPDPPRPFKRVMSPDGQSARIAMVFPGEGGAEHEEVIYENDVYPQSIVYDEREGRYVVEVRRWLPKDGWETFPVPLGQLYDKRRLSVLLGDIGVLPDIGKVDLLVQYMLGYIRELQKTAAATTVYAQLGWRDDGQFVLGDRVIRGDKTEPVTTHKNIANALSWRPPQGDLNEWRKVVAMYERDGLEAFQFGIGVGFAAPLFRFTNFTGMIVSMVGERGSGKSSIMHVVNTIWGHKTHSWADMEHDTTLSFYNKLGVLKNLPVCYDEVTNLPEDDLSDLCYAVSKGQGRQRLHQDGSARENHGTWQTMMLTTSNASLHSRLSLAKADASAESVRVFEYYVPSNMVPKAEADETLDLLNDHFGLAGEVFIKEVNKDLPAVREDIKRWTRYMEDKAGVTSGERFWAAGAACVLAATAVTNRCGLTDVDIDRLAAFSVHSIRTMRDAVEDNTRTSTSVIGDFLNSNLDKMLTFNMEPAADGRAFAVVEPRSELRIRYEAWHDLAFVDRAFFRTYCAARQVDINRLKSDLKRKGILQDERRVVLGRGTQWRTAQVWVWVLNMAHPDLGNAKGAATAANAAEVAGSAIDAAREYSRT